MNINLSPDFFNVIFYLIFLIAIFFVYRNYIFGSNKITERYYNNYSDISNSNNHIFSILKSENNIKNGKIKDLENMIQQKDKYIELLEKNINKKEDTKIVDKPIEKV